MTFQEMINALKVDAEYLRDKEVCDAKEIDMAIRLLKGDEKMNIKIKYHTGDIEKLRYIDGKSDWIDLRSAEDVELKAGDFKLISLGVSMELPKGYEAHIVPRSSTFKTWGIIQTNSMGK